MDEEIKKRQPRVYFSCVDFQVLMAGPNGSVAPQVEDLFRESDWGRRFAALMSELHAMRDMEGPSPDLGGITVIEVTNKIATRRAHGELDRIDQKRLVSDEKKEDSSK